MTIFGIQSSVLVVALITAYIGYQFNHRAKRREIFLKEILTSYNEVYFPMFEYIGEINKTEDKYDKFKLIQNFFSKYDGSESKIRFIGTSFLLEHFYELRSIYRNYQTNRNATNEKKLIDNFNEFYTMIEEEFWDAHDIIYVDHLKFKSTSHKNPFIILMMELFAAIYHITVFLLWISLLIIYFSVWNHFIHLEPIPIWWRIKYALFIFIFVLILFGSILSISTFVIKKNRRKNITAKRIKEKILKWYRKKRTNVNANFK